ncbi:MAG: hypothetical protein RIB32_03520 [Phycisphaerales bacterium]
MADDRYDQTTEDERDRQRSLMIKILRVSFLLLLVVVVVVGILTDSTDKDGQALLRNWWAAVTLALFFFLSVVALDILTPRHKLATISSLFFGILAGVLATLLLSFVIDLFFETYVDQANRGRWAVPVLTLQIALGLGLCYLGVSTILQTQNDFRLVIPYVEFTKQYRGARPFLLDTSALIDGRVLDIAGVGILQAPIVIPRFVIAELQVLGDSSDRLKRARGRRGLEMVSALQRTPSLDVTIDESDVRGKDVDQKLVELARSMPATIVTLDLGLNRVASIHGVPVVNINDLANALKPNAIPGEAITVELIRAGEQEGQAVGYLDDGTMIVAENGAAAIGRRAVINVTSTMQTSAGRLIFGRLAEETLEMIAAEHPAPAAKPREPESTDEPEDESPPPSPPSPSDRDDPDRPERPRSSARNPRRR